jgi:hypothetical protein
MTFGLLTYDPKSDSVALLPRRILDPAIGQSIFVANLSPRLMNSINTEIPDTAILPVQAPQTRRSDIF